MVGRLEGDAVESGLSGEVARGEAWRETHGKG